MAKEIKTNAMRILDRLKIKYTLNTYQCDEFTDGMQIADMLGQPYEKSFKTIVCRGKSGEYFVFVLPVDKSIDLKKASKSVGEKSVELLHVKDINKVTGYIRGGCTPIGMKKQYKTVVSRTAEKLQKMYVSAGKLGCQIYLKPEDLLRASQAVYGDIIVL